jgi:hypothetical protein
MTEVIVGLEQLLALLRHEGIPYEKDEHEGEKNPFGTIRTKNAIMTYRRA